MPRRTGFRFATTPQDPQLADFINVGDLRLRVPDAKPDPFDKITKPKLLFRVGSRSCPHSKFGIGSVNRSLDP
jgi:hypothetical protein